MARAQHRDMLEIESGSDYDFSEAEGTGRSPIRVGLLLVLGVVGVAAMTSSTFRPLKAKLGAVIGESTAGSEWETSGKFSPETLPVALQPSEALNPSENLNDGNTCNDDEELFQNLCYKKCSILTQGTHRIRTTSMSCCNADKIQDCNFKNQEVEAKICDGFDVAGNINGQTSACPHVEGNCYENEELFLGQCYKKCSELAGTEYANRISSWSCCKASSLTGCSPFGGNVKTASTYAVGGKDTSNNNILEHAPIKSIDEAASSTA